MTGLRLGFVEAAGIDFGRPFWGLTMPKFQAEFLHIKAKCMFVQHPKRTAVKSNIYPANIAPLAHLPPSSLRVV